MDYKNRIPDYRPNRPAPKKDRTGLWASLAVVIGLVAVAIGWFVTRPKDEPVQQPVQAEVGPPASSKATTALALPTTKPTVDKKTSKPLDPAKPAQETTPTPPVKLPEPRFTFYKILPELEAIVPESEIKNLKREESLSKKPPSVQYQLQVYSYNNVQDAEKLKAKLSALKIRSHIETIKIDNVTWNRVKIGPFTSLASADDVRSILRGKQIDSVVQKSVTKPPAQPTTKPAQAATKPAPATPKPVPAPPPAIGTKTVR